MPTVIDSLIVTLGLDPKNFNDQQKKTSETWLKTVAGFQKGGKVVEESSKKAAETVNLITRRVLELFAVLTGSQAISQFAGQIITADAALGRFASSLGESPQRLSEWGNAAQQFGGSAEATAGTLERVNKQLFDLNRNGHITPDLYKLQAWAGMNIDTSHGIDKYLSDVSAALQKLHETKPGDAHVLAQSLGIEPATEQLMYTAGRNIDALLAKYKDRAPSDAAIAASQKLQASWADLSQQATALGNTVLTAVGPAISNVIAKMTDWIDKNKDWINTGIVEMLKKFIDYLSSIDWNAVGTGLHNFAVGAKDVVDGLGGIITTTEVLFGLWAGARFLSVLGNMRLLGGMLLGGGAGGGAAAAAGEGAAGAGLMGLMGTLAPFLAMLTLSGDTPQGKGKGVYYTDRDIDTITQMKHYDRGGPQSRGRGAETTVDGNPVSKSNPLPVTISDNKSDGGGFWSNLVSGIGDMFGGGRGARAASAGGEVGAMAGRGIGGPQSSSSGTKGWWTPERQAHAYETLKAAGLSDAGARGLVSRWKNVEATGGPSSVNSVGAMGIAQWLSRRGALMSYAKAHGKNWNDFDTQLGFAVSELHGSEARAARALRNAKTDAQGATGASMYERAEGYNGATDNFTQKTYRGMAAIITGAKAAALSNITATHSATTSKTSVENHIGKIDVHSQATDANGIAGDISGALDRRLFTTQANYGLA